jgi:hypothetical protein
LTGEAKPGEKAPSAAFLCAVDRLTKLLKKAALGAFSPGFASPVNDGAKVVTFVHQ